jgi:hypothetical protein
MCSPSIVFPPPPKHPPHRVASSISPLKAPAGMFMRAAGESNSRSRPPSSTITLQQSQHNHNGCYHLSLCVTSCSLSASLVRNGEGIIGYAVAHATAVGGGGGRRDKGREGGGRGGRGREGEGALQFYPSNTCLPAVLRAHLLLVPPPTCLHRLWC